MSEEFSFDLDEKSIKNIKEAIGLDEIEARHQRFMNGTETIDDLINHIYHYKIKNNDGLDLDVVEKKYYEKIVDLYIAEKEKNKKIKDKIKMETNRLKEHGYWEFLEQRDLDKTISIIQNLLEE